MTTRHTMSDGVRPSGIARQPRDGGREHVVRRVRERRRTAPPRGVSPVPLGVEIQIAGGGACVVRKPRGVTLWVRDFDAPSEGGEVLSVYGPSEDILRSI